ncbi:hypothetical protein [Alteromonas portus]|uniref:hypothetical protein n=1 Tax=Alteromonas portus TaxID=2565549 RepID=UPI003BF7BE80
MSKEDNQAAIDQINQVFSEKAKDALAIAMVTRTGEVLFHYAATGASSNDVANASYVIEMIKTLSESK